jgi:hypothetical protein
MNIPARLPCPHPECFQDYQRPVYGWPGQPPPSYGAPAPPPASTPAAATPPNGFQNENLFYAGSAFQTMGGYPESDRLSDRHSSPGSHGRCSIGRDSMGSAGGGGGGSACGRSN